jgi:hypothetical protein
VYSYSNLVNFIEGIGSMKTTIKKGEGEQQDMELPSFDFGRIAFATDDFSNNNKLGEGGFGPVYRVSISNMHPVI